MQTGGYVYAIFDAIHLCKQEVCFFPVFEFVFGLYDIAPRCIVAFRLDLYSRFLD